MLSDNQLPLTNDPELERALLTHILFLPHSIREVAPLLQPHHFYNEAHEAIFRAMLAVPHPDRDSVLAQLRADGTLRTAGGATMIDSLSNPGFAVSGDATAYARMLREKAWRREAIVMLQDLAGLVVRGDRTIASVYHAMTNRISNMGGPLGRNVTTARALADDSIDRITRAVSGQSSPSWQTGFPKLDELLGYRFGPGMYLLLFGPTNVGKTALGAQLALAAGRQGPTLYVSLESGADEIWNRILAAESEIALTRILDGTLTPDEHAETARINGELATLELEIVTDLKSADQIEQYIADMTVRYQFRPGMVIVDNVDNLSDMMGGNKRYEKLTTVSNMLLTITRRTGWGVVGLKQMNIPDLRGLRPEAFKAQLYPSLYSIEGARTLAQHASNIVGMYSTDWIRGQGFKDYEDANYPAGAMAFCNLKARNSARKKVYEIFLGWDDAIPMFRNKATQHIDFDPPRVFGRDD